MKFGDIEIGGYSLGPARRRFYGRQTEAVKYLGLAKAQLGQLKQRLAIHGLPYGSAQYGPDPDNVMIRVATNQNGLAPVDDIAIYVPPPPVKKRPKKRATGFVIHAYGVAQPFSGMSADDIAAAYPDLDFRVGGVGPFWHGGGTAQFINTWGGFMEAEYIFNYAAAGTASNMYSGSRIHYNTFTLKRGIIFEFTHPSSDWQGIDGDLGAQVYWNARADGRVLRGTTMPDIFYYSEDYYWQNAKGRTEDGVYFMGNCFGGVERDCYWTNAPLGDFNLARDWLGTGDSWYVGESGMPHSATPTYITPPRWGMYYLSRSPLTIAANPGDLEKRLIFIRDDPEWAYSIETSDLQPQILPMEGIFDCRLEQLTGDYRLQIGNTYQVGFSGVNLTGITSELSAQFLGAVQGPVEIRVDVTLLPHREVISGLLMVPGPVSNGTENYESKAGDEWALGEVVINASGGEVLSVSIG